MIEANEAQLQALRELDMHKQPSPAMEKLLQERTDALLEEAGLQLGEKTMERAQTKRAGIYYSPAADNDNGLPGALCTCGQGKYHTRIKILFKWAERHEAKTGHPMLVKEWS